ncbi:hypothetical protein Hte_010201 [Hypoxylon texense]
MEVVDSLACYRLLLHPLRAYPGPFVAKLSDAYNGYFAAKRSLHLVAHRNHVKYGPVIRHGPNKLLFNTVTALHEIYDTERLVKSHVYDSIQLAPDVYSLFSVVDRKVHRTKLRVVGQAINERGMRVFEPTMAQQVDLFVKLLFVSSKSSTPVNLSERVGYFACDIVSLLSLGYPLNLQTDPTNRFMIQGMFRANYFGNIR